MDDSIEVLSNCITFLFQAFADLRHGQRMFDAADRGKLGTKGNALAQSLNKIAYLIVLI